MRIAVPAYGSRIMPRFGVARVFYLADIDRKADGAHSLEPHRWEPDLDPDLSRWLGGLGVSGVICAGIHPRFQMALERDGLWVLWGQRGDVREVVESWCRDGLAAPGGYHRPRSAGTGPGRQRCVRTRGEQT